MQELITQFRNGLIATLGENLVGAYLLGSIAFPGFEPHLADIDFHVITRRPLSPEEQKRLDRFHHTLAREFRFGARLDGFYIPLVQARKRNIPERLVGVGEGQLHRGTRDAAWALHLEHLHHNGYIALFGPDPKSIYPQPSSESTAAALDRELRSVRRNFRRYPAYAVLNLCRLLYSWRTGRVAVSKRAAAEWALERFPAEWRGLIRTAVDHYAGRSDTSGRSLLRTRIGGFLMFTEQRIVEAKELGRINETSQSVN